MKSQGAATGVDYQLGDLEGENGELLLVTTDMDVNLSCSLSVALIWDPSLLFSCNPIYEAFTCLAVES